jgi:hypothetical protein
MSRREDTSRPLWHLLAPLLAAVLLGALLGRISAPSSLPPEARAPAPSRAGARAVAGVTVSFPESAEGAAAAIATYQSAFADPAILDPARLRARVEAVATPEYAARMLAVNGPGGEAIAAGPIGIGLAHGVQTLYAAVPIGYRVLAYSPGRARIENWGFTLLGNAGSVEPAAYFGISKVELVWMDGRWRIARVRSGYGPTPHLATKPGPLGGYDVMGLARDLHSYALAP